MPRSDPRPSLPDTIPDVAALEELLSRPTPALVEDLARVPGDIAVVGVGGKVGPTLARMLTRADPARRVIGIARFSEPGLRERLASWGVETIACDVLDRAAVMALPDAANVVYMAGRKFGTEGDQPLTWAMNALAPAHVAERYRAARIVAFSTLCVYPFAPVDGPGCDEATPPTPVGEYANSCVARERVLQWHSRRHGTPGRIARLNYAIDLRYGVLHDVGARVLAGEPIDLATGWANVIWQGDATAMILRCLRHAEVPASPINIGAPRPARIRDVALAFGERFGRAPVLVGEERPEAWHNDCSLAARLLGPPDVPLERMIAWNADWLARGGAVHGKPTRYEQRAGRF